MSIIQIAIILVIIGAALYLLELAPMNDTFKKIVRVIIIVFAIIVALKLLLPMAGLS